MKNAAHCPRCEGRVFYRIEEVKFPDPESSNTFEGFGLTGFYAETGVKSFFGGEKARSVVEVEAWVCKDCGYTEMYTKNLELLEQCVGSVEGVSVVDRSSDEGPFR